MSSRLVVDTGGRWHTYSLDGERVLSVSTVKNAVGGKDGLLGWAAKAAANWALANTEAVPVLGEAAWVRECAGAANRERDASALAGKQVHSIAERLIFGEPVDTADPLTGEVYSDDVIRMGEQTARFMDAWNVSPDSALVEAPVFHEELRYAGTFDLVCEMKDRERWIIDYKTGQSGVWIETALQLTGYAHATHIQIGDRDMLMPPIARGAALWVRPDKWQLIPCRIDDEMWRIFQHALEIAKWLRLSRENTIGAALPIPPERVA